MSGLDATLVQFFEATDVEPRLDRLRRFVVHLERQGRCEDGRGMLSRSVAWIERRLVAVGEDDLVHTRLEEAEARAYELAVQPRLARDTKRQNGTRKERRPDITEWIDKQLDRDANAKSPDLWAMAPDEITDQIGERRFATRVTARRKARASK